MPENGCVPLPVFPSGQARAIQQFLTLQEVSLVSCVLWKNQAPWELKWRTCSDSMLLLPFRGGFEAELEGARYVVRPGQFLMIPEHTPHTLRILPGEPHLHQVSIHCEIHDRWHLPFLGWFDQPIGRLSGIQSWKDKLYRLSSLLRTDSKTGRLWGENLLRELLVEQLLEGDSYRIPDRTADPRVETLIRRLKEEKESPLLSVEELAREVGLTPVQMRKLFKRETGESPKGFLIQLRMRHAEHLLRHTRMRIKEVAFACGFASDHYFHSRFRKVYAMTPEQYRNHLEEPGQSL